MRGYLEDLKAGGRSMTDKELAEHYKHLYSEAEKQKDDVVERCKQEISASSIQYEREHKQQHLVYKVAHERILRMLGEIE